jgi:hypothetical protein
MSFFLYLLSDYMGKLKKKALLITTHLLILHVLSRRAGAGDAGVGEM